MNPYQPPPDDESQLDRIERKIDSLNGSYMLAIAISGTLAALVFLLVEILGRWKF
jgi:hypothetical protein